MKMGMTFSILLAAELLNLKYLNAFSFALNLFSQNIMFGVKR